MAYGAHQLCSGIISLSFVSCVGRRLRAKADPNESEKILFFFMQKKFFHFIKNHKTSLQFLIFLQLLILWFYVQSVTASIVSRRSIKLSILIPKAVNGFAVEKS